MVSLFLFGRADLSGGAEAHLERAAPVGDVSRVSSALSPEDGISQRYEPEQRLSQRASGVSVYLFVPRRGAGPGERNSHCLPPLFVFTIIYLWFTISKV